MSIYQLLKKYAAPAGRFLCQFKLDLSKRGSWLQLGLTFLMFCLCLSGHHSQSVTQGQVAQHSTEIQNLQQVSQAFDARVKAAQDTLTAVEARLKVRAAENRQLINAQARVDSLQNRWVQGLEARLENVEEARAAFLKGVPTATDQQMSDFFGKIPLGGPKR